MKSRVFWTFALAFCLVACGKQPPAEETTVAAAAEASTVAAEPAPVKQESPEPVLNQAFLDHMHAHAERVDELMYALDDGDLEAAMAPAYWLSRHNPIDGIQDDWQPFVQGMREAAAKVEQATDLQSARAAAEQISVHCQGCHAAAGILRTE
jgi:hypothetical protein